MNEKLTLFLVFLGAGVLAAFFLLVKDYLEKWALKECQKKHEAEIQKAKIEENIAHKKAQEILEEATQVQNSIERKNELETRKIKEQMEKTQKEAKQILEEANIEAYQLRAEAKKTRLLEIQRIEDELGNAQKKAKEIVEQAEKEAEQLQDEIGQKPGQQHLKSGIMK